MPNILVTGGAGFIGSHLVDHLLAEKRWRVTVVDDFNDFYAPEIKRENVRAHEREEAYRLIECDIREREALKRVFADEKFDVIVHLAARAGVRPSLREPLLYAETNINGTLNLLELARQRDVQQFVFGSSSSVYGINAKVPFSEKDPIHQPISPYAATKAAGELLCHTYSHLYGLRCVCLRFFTVYGINAKVPFSEEDPIRQPISPYAATKAAGELLCHTYSHLYGLRCVCLRFFTVYGARQRPDLAIHKFARLIDKGEPIPVFGDGTTRRDYTYIDDIIAGVRAAIDYEASPYEVINLGESRTVELGELIALLENALDRHALIDRQPMQPGDVPQTFADIEKARRLLGYNPQTEIEDGIRRFVEWFRSMSRK